MPPSRVLLFSALLLSAAPQSAIADTSLLRSLIRTCLFSRDAHTALLVEEIYNIHLSDQDRAKLVKKWLARVAKPHQAIAVWIQPTTKYGSVIKYRIRGEQILSALEPPGSTHVLAEINPEASEFHLRFRSFRFSDIFPLAQGEVERERVKDIYKFRILRQTLNQFSTRPINEDWNVYLAFSGESLEQRTESVVASAKERVLQILHPPGNQPFWSLRETKELSEYFQTKHYQEYLEKILLFLRNTLNSPPLRSDEENRRHLAQWISDHLGKYDDRFFSLR